LEMKINDIQSDIKGDSELESAWDDLLTFMRTSLESKKDVERDSWRQQIVEKIEQLRLYIYKYRDRIFSLLQDVDELITSIREDQTLQEFSGSVDKLATDLFYDKNGRMTLKPEALKSFPVILKPLLEKEFKYISLPPIVNKDKDMDYEITNAVMKFHGLFPDQIIVDNSNHLRIGSEKYVNATAELYVGIKGMVIDIQDMEVRYRKHTFPELEDQGTANLRISGADVELWLSGDVYDSRAFRVDNVDVDLRGLSLHGLDFHRHEFLYYVLKPVIEHNIRKEIEKKVESQLCNKLFNIDTMVVEVAQKAGTT